MKINIATKYKWLMQTMLGNVSGQGRPVVKRRLRT